ncbi:MAG: VWA domain-containing protein [Acidobacteria bacterium]|nr:VWA domain-containing protein [Acidobacteriota bacterium]
MPESAAFWTALESLHFLRPAWLIALFPVALLWWLQRRSDDPVRRFSQLIAPHLLEHLIVDPRAARGGFRPIHLVVLLLVMSIVGAAGPSWRREPSPFATDTAPVMVALDLSRSMDAIDLQPTRLDHAKQKIRDFVAARPGAKTGLLAYAGTAHLVLPPTEDPEIYATFLDALATNLMPVPGTDMAAALEQSLTTLDRQDVAGTVVVVTGGGDTDADAVATALAGSPHQALVLAIGTEQGGPIRRGESDFLVENGQRVISRLDPEEFDALESVADVYVTRATIDDTDVNRLVARTQSHLENAIEEDATQRWHDAGYWLTWPVALLGLLWFRRGWTVRWEQVLAGLGAATLLAGLALPIPLGAQDESEEELPATPVEAEPTWQERWTDLWWTPDQQGRRLLEQGNFAAAAERFEDQHWRGVAAYRAADWDGAISAFAAITTAGGSYNLGNAYAQKGELELAIAAYDQALEQRPGWAEAEANRELVASLIPPEPEAPPQGQGQPTFSADQIEFDLDEDQGEEGEVEMAAFTDDQMTDMWLRQLKTSPAGFLRTKFAIQAARLEPTEESR